MDERSGSGWRYLGCFSLAGGKSDGGHHLAPHDDAGLDRGGRGQDRAPLATPRERPGSAGRGWAATARGLSSTVDGGVSWEPVSPPGVIPAQIRGVRISGTQGWLVVATGGRKTPLALYSTADRGRTWTSSSLPVPADVDVAAAADVEAVGTQLFVGIRLQPNRFGLSRGALLKSEDGVDVEAAPASRRRSTRLPHGEGRLAGRRAGKRAAVRDA